MKPCLNSCLGRLSWTFVADGIYLIFLRVYETRADRKIVFLLLDTRRNADGSRIVGGRGVRGRTGRCAFTYNYYCRSRLVPVLVVRWSAIVLYYRYYYYGMIH